LPLPLQLHRRARYVDVIAPQLRRIPRRLRCPFPRVTRPRPLTKHDVSVRRSRVPPGLPALGYPGVHVRSGRAVIRETRVLRTTPRLFRRAMFGRAPLWHVAVGLQRWSVLPANVCRRRRFVNRSGARTNLGSGRQRGGATLGAVSLWSIATYPMSFEEQRPL
jgi:hypothetical protein